MDEKSAMVLFTLGVPVTVGLVYAFVVRYQDVRREGSKIESDVNLLKWMVGFNLAVTVVILFRVFS